MSVSDFDFSFLEVMNKNFLINVTLKLGLNKFETRNSLAGVPLYALEYVPEASHPFELQANCETRARCP